MRPAPTRRVPGLSGVVAISAAAFHSLAPSMATARSGRGDGIYLGQLGDDSTVDRHSPVTVPNLRGVMSIASGGLHGVASIDNGHVFAGGHNGLGQLGDRTTQDRQRTNAGPFRPSVAHHPARLPASVFDLHA